MEQHTNRRHRQPDLSLRLTQVAGLAIALVAPLAGGHAQAQTDTAPAAVPDQAWHRCASLTQDKVARLSCFDDWASQQTPHTPGTVAGANPPLASNEPRTPSVAPAAEAAPVPPVQITMEAPTPHDCKHNRFSELSRFWELEAGSDCGTFGIRGYRPISLSWIGSDSVNTQPSSPTASHTASTAQPYNLNETRIQVSVRTKIAQGLLTGLLSGQQTLLRDSLWFGYTQQSYWQLFNGDLSRPFRTTDHEPEITYIYPTEAALPAGWRLRYSGVSLVHQSNGQTLPLSRSWNRTVFMAGLEKGDQFKLLGRYFNRLNEESEDDDNPEISDLVGRAEVTGIWNVNKINTLALTVRHSLRANANGSMRLEWLRNVSDSGVVGGRNGLRFHTQLFSGYGDSLVDYNRRRTVLSLGLSLVDW